MENLLASYYNELDSSNFDFKSITSGFSDLSKRYGEQMENSGDKEGLKYLTFENELLHLGKSVEKELTPMMSNSGLNEEGIEVTTMWPDYRKYDTDTYSYFEKRYKTTENLYLKTEYGLLLYLKGFLKKSGESKILAEQLIELADIYWAKSEKNEDKKIYRFSAREKWMDAFLILSRGGKSLQDNLNDFVLKLQEKFLSCKVDSASYSSLSGFIISCFTEHRKKIQSVVKKDDLLTHLENGAKYYLPVNIDAGIRISKGVLKFSNSYNLTPSDNFQIMIAQSYETIGDTEISKENWFGGVKTFEDALKYFTVAKDTVGITRVKSKIDANKGKFEMGLFSSEMKEDENQMINEYINDIVNSGNVLRIIAGISGYAGILPVYSKIYPEAIKSSQEPSFLNHITPQSMDKYGNTIRVYDKEDIVIYHLYQAMDLQSQLGFQIIREILRRAIGNGKLSYQDIEHQFKSSWLNEEIQLYSNGGVIKVIPLEAILPGIKSFIDELTKAITTNGYEPNFVCCTDSMAIKIEYAFRNMCFKLGISTFSHQHKDSIMIYEEMALGKLLSSLEEVLGEDETWLIRFLINEKGGRNLRNKAAHGLLDSNEYGFTRALTAFSVLLRMSTYEFHKEVVK